MQSLFGKLKMRKSASRRFKRGVASFYIVAISTLILVIIGASFAGVIISAVTRTSNDDLSQSAYDAALAGLEDAKLVLYDYQQCKLVKAAEAAGDGTAANDARNKLVGNGIDCGGLINWVEQGASYGSSEDCDVVANILNRPIARDPNNNNNPMGVLVQESYSGSTDANGMLQYYTCVKINSQTDNLLGQLTTERPNHAFKVQFKDSSAMENVDKVRISWHSTTQNGDRVGFKWPDDPDQGAFPKEKSKPAIIAFSIAQSGPSFSLSDFDKTENGETNRGTIYLIPHKGGVAGGELYEAKGQGEVIAANEGLAKSNDKGSTNRGGTDDTRNFPFVIECDDKSQEYVCEATAELPKPIGGSRANLVTSVALLYAEPNTDFALTFLDASGNTLTLDAVQVSIDSTGRANDLFRRVDTRLEAADVAYPFPLYAIEALDTNNPNAIWKNFYSTCEYDFDDHTCSRQP